MKKIVFIVVLLASLLAGQLVTAQVTIVTNPSPAAICAGSGTFVSLTAPDEVGGVPAISYVWSTGSTNQGINVSPAGTTTYTVTVTMLGGSTQTGSATVTVYLQPTTPTITPGVATTICEGESLALTSSVAASYQWQTNGVPIPSSNVQTYNASASGDYRVRITDVNGCHSSWSIITTVTVIPLPIAHVTVDNNETCYPDAITLTADPVTGASYQWWYSDDGMPGTWSIEPGITNVIYGTTSGRYGVAVTIGSCTNRSFVP